MFHGANAEPEPIISTQSVVTSLPSGETKLDLDVQQSLTILVSDEAARRRLLAFLESHSIVIRKISLKYFGGVGSGTLRFGCT